ncbi:MAG: hypothetical protein GXO26_03210, partial [Crenarchaeota archaeon]|nr:hypothetical protein [Thermoproteota archaeon]
MKLYAALEFGSYFKGVTIRKIQNYIFELSKVLRNRGLPIEKYIEETGKITIPAYLLDRAYRLTLVEYLTRYYAIDSYTLDAIMRNNLDKEPVFASLLALNSRIVGETTWKEKIVIETRNGITRIQTHVDSTQIDYTTKLDINRVLQE